jgi:hypothetical protein
MMTTAATTTIAAPAAVGALLADYRTWADTPPRERRRVIPSPESITPTTPLRLDIAAQIAFPDGTMGVSGLRTEINNGNLAAEKIAGRLYVTLAAIDNMRKLCAVTPKARDSSSETRDERASPTAGSSPTAMPTENESSARQAHLRQVAQRLRDSSRSPKKL